MQGMQGTQASPEAAAHRSRTPFRGFAACFLSLGLFGLWALAERAVGQEALSEPGRLEEPELQVVRSVVDDLRAADGAALSTRVDFPRRFEEQLQRGHGTRTWADLDETDQMLERQLLARAWTQADAAWMSAAGLIAATELPDPDAGHGPVPDRRIVQAVVRNQVNGEQRDLLLTLTPELQLLDLSIGKRYFEGANPAGETGLQPAADFVRPARPVVLWPADLLDLEREDAGLLVTRLLDTRVGRERELAIERLHRAPRASVAALLERLDQLDLEESPDAEAEALLASALARITGRSADVTAVARNGMPEPTWREANHQSVLGWLTWHERYGGSFVPTDIVDPIEPAVGERREALPKVPLSGWDRKLLEQKAIREGTATGTDTASGAADGRAAAPSAPSAPGLPPSPPGHAPDPPVTSAPPPPAAAPDDSGHPAPAPDDSGPTVKLPSVGGTASPRNVLFPAAANLKFRLGTQEVVGREVESRLTPSLKEALNAWAEPATRFGFSVVMSGNPEALVLGSAKDDTLRDAAKWMDEAFAILDPLVSAANEREPRATVAILFDEKAARSPAWSGLLDDLVGRRLMFESAAESLRAAPAGLMLRGAGLFLQPTYDVAGNAAAGDDEFRLRNEVLHKYAQCLITSRCGQLPPTILWGLGEVVELQLTKSVYMFNTTGFVPTGDHTDWSQRAKQYLEKRHGKKRGATRSADAMNDGAAGLAVEPQMTTWATLAFMADKQPATLRDLLLELSALHAAADSRGRATLYRGDAEKTAALLAARFDSVENDELVRWLEQHR